MGSPAHNRATAKYDAENTIRITIKFNKKTDADILKALDAEESKAGFIKAAIRNSIAKNK